jgi:broad specificity phosphatase PhoE
MNVNFAFLRHGHGCHNAISNLVSYNMITRDQGRKFLYKKDDTTNILKNDILPLHDPVLTHLGVEASVYNGCIINKILKNLSRFTAKTELQMDTFNVVGCSPLIRCMETAYYMTRKWKNPPNKIYVFPLLREIDESSMDKYSEQSKEIIRITPSYSIKSINEQKEYLRQLGILDKFDFSFVEAFPTQRIEPGDIKEFLKWFGKYFMKLLDKKEKKLNVFIVTHAGVLRDFAQEGFYNNSGFVINTIFDKTKRDFTTQRYISLNNYIDKYNFFKDYNNPMYNTKTYYCPSNRCGQLCSVSAGSSSDKVKKLNLQCDPNS